MNDVNEASMETMAPLLDAITSTQSTALAVIPPSSLPTILAADENDILGTLAKKIAAHKPDISTPKGRREIASLAAEVASSKMDLIRLGKSLTESWRKSTKAVNEECNLIEERMDALKVQVRQPLTDFENAEKARIAGHEAALAEITGWATVDPAWTSVQIAARITELGAHPHRERDWQEFRQRAQDAAAAAFNALKVARMELAEREAQAAEDARLAAEEAERQRAEAARLQAEREARIAAEAAEAARVEAERVAAEEAAMIERQAQAERDAAARRERETAEALALAERQRQEAEARAETARMLAHTEALEAICEHPGFGAAETSAELRRRLEYLNNYPARDWQEYADKAAKTLATEISRTESLLATAEQREAKQAEAARIEAERLAEATRQAAVEAERRRQEQEAARIAEKTRKREANVAHRRKINREAVAAVALAMSEAFEGNQEGAEKIAVAIVTAIAKSEIPHVSISY
jgi:hypothetical protein